MSEDRSASNVAFALDDLILMLVRGWWMIAAIALISTAGAVAYALSQPDVYEARTRVLIGAPISGGLQANGVLSSVGPDLAIEALEALAQARDLFQEVVDRLDLRDVGSDARWPAERLAGVITVTVETAGREPPESVSPLLTITVRGDDPQQLKRIAEAWVEAFEARTSALFTNEATRAYEFLLAQEAEKRSALEALEDELLSNSLATPLPIMTGELAVLRAAYEDALAELHLMRALLAEATAPDAGFVTTLVLDRAVRPLGAAGTRGEPAPALRATSEIPPGQAVVVLSANVVYLDAEVAKLRDAAEGLLRKITTVELERARLNRDISILGQELDRLTKNVQNAAIASDERLSTIRIVESAVEPRRPVGPNRRLQVMVGGLIGLVLGSAVVVVLRLSDVAFGDVGSMSGRSDPGEPAA